MVETPAEGRSLVADTMPAVDLPYAPFVCWARWRITQQEQDLGDRASDMPCYALWHCVNGRLHMERGTEALTLQRGACVLLPPSSGWRFLLGPDDIASYMVFDVMARPEPVPARPDRPVGEAQPQPEAVWGVPVPIPLPAAEHARTRRALMQVNRLWWLSPLDHLRANLVLGEWLLDLLGHLIAAKDAQSPLSAIDDPFARAEAWAKRHLDLADVRGMAEIAGMSRPRFCARYREERGRLAGQYLNELRIAAALRRIRSGQRSLVAVARAIGWRKAETLRRHCRDLLPDSINRRPGRPAKT